MQPQTMPKESHKNPERITDQNVAIEAHKQEQKIGEDRKTEPNFSL